jgi:hypothetical protein
MQSNSDCRVISAVRSILYFLFIFWVINYYRLISIKQTKFNWLQCSHFSILHWIQFPFPNLVSVEMKQKIDATNLRMDQSSGFTQTSILWNKAKLWPRFEIWMVHMILEVICFYFLFICYTCGKAGTWSRSRLNMHMLFFLLFLCDLELILWLQCWFKHMNHECSADRYPKNKVTS